MSRFISALAAIGLLLLAPMAIAQDSSESAGQAKQPELQDFVLGYHKAPVELIVYGSVFSGGYTQVFFDDYIRYIESRYVSKDKVRLVFRHHISDTAHLVSAVVSNCIPRSLFFDFAKTAARFSEMDENINNYYKEVIGPNLYRNPLDYILRITNFYGIYREDLEKCLSDASLVKALQEQSQNYGEKHNVNSWPNYVINDENHGGVSNLDELDALIQSYLSKN